MKRWDRNWFEGIIERHDWYEFILIMLFRVLAITSLLVPLVYSTQLLYGISTTKHFFFRTIVSLLFAIYLLLLIHNRKYAPRLSPMTLVLVGIFIAYAISSVLAGTAIASFWGNYIRMDGLIGWGYYLAYYVALTHVIRDRDWWLLLIVGTVISYWVALVAVSQYLGASLVVASSGEARSTAIFGNAAYYAWYQAMMLFVVMLVWVQKHTKISHAYFLVLLGSDVVICSYAAWSWWVKHQPSDIDFLFRNIYFLSITIFIHWLAWRHWRSRIEIYRSLLLFIIAAVGVIGLWTSNSKAAFIAVPAGMIVSLIVWTWRRWVSSWHWHKQLIAGVSLAALIVLMGVIMLSSSSSTHSFGQKVIAGSSLNDRLLVWGASWDAFRAKPWLGWGMDNFPQAFDRYYPSQLYDSAASPLWYDKAHSIYGQYAVEGGAIVVLLYAILLWLIIRSGLRGTRGNRALEAVCIGFVVMYLIMGLVYFDTIANVAVLFLLLAMLRQQSEPQQQQWLQSPVRLLIPHSVMIVLVITGSLLFWYNFTGRQLISNWNYIRLVANIEQSDGSIRWDTVDELHRNVINAPTLGKSDLRSKFATLVGDLSLVRPDEIKNRPYLAMAFDDLKKNIAKRPNTLLPTVELINYSLIAGRIDPVYWDYGKDVADQLLAIAPSRIQLLYLAGRLDIVRGDVDSGLRLFQKAIDLRPMFDTYFNYYKQIASLVPDAELESYYDSHISQYPLQNIYQVVQFDLAMNKPKRALAHLRSAAPQVSQRSDMVNAVATWQRLAAIAYQQIGENEKAVNAARQSFMLAPSESGDLLRYFPELQR